MCTFYATLYYTENALKRRIRSHLERDRKTLLIRFGDFWLKKNMTPLWIGGLPLRSQANEAFIYSYSVLMKQRIAIIVNRRWQRATFEKKMFTDYWKASTKWRSVNKTVLCDICSVFPQLRRFVKFDNNTLAKWNCNWGLENYKFSHLLECFNGVVKDIC